jgi:hypothetical protein
VFQQQAGYLGARQPLSATGTRPAAEEPPPPKEKPTFTPDQLKKLADVRHPGLTSSQERIELATRLTERLNPSDAVDSARFLVEMSSGEGGMRYIGGDVEVDVEYRKQPLEQATADFLAMLDRLGQCRGRTSGSRGWGDFSRAQFALAVVNCVLADQPEQKAEFLSLLHDYGDPYLACSLQRLLARVPAPHRQAVRQAIDRDYTHNEKGEPRRWGPPQNWYKGAKLTLFMASLLGPDQPLEAALEASERLGPRIEKLQEAEKKVFSSYKPDPEVFRHAAENYRDPGEDAFQAIERQLDQIDKLAGKGLKVTEQRHVVGYISHPLKEWQPGFKSLPRVVDELLATDVPTERLATIGYNLHLQQREGESVRQTLDRLADTFHDLERRLGQYGENALGDAFSACLLLGGDEPAPLLADLADRWAERHDPKDLGNQFFSHARTAYRSGDGCQDLLSRIEQSLAFTGSVGGLRHLDDLLDGRVKEGKVTPERRQEFESQKLAWVGAARLIGDRQPGQLPEALLTDQPLDLSGAFRDRPNGDLVTRLTPEAIVETVSALGESERLGRRLGYPRELILQTVQSVLRESGPEAALTLPALLEELSRSEKRPSPEELSEMVRATVAGAAAGSLSAEIPLADRIARVEHSHYLTGSYQGLQKALERLQVWQDSGTLRQDVPFDVLSNSLESHIMQLRVTGTPAEKTVELAFDRLRESEYSAEGSALGQTVGLVGDRLAIGSVPLRLRKRT